MTQEEKVRKYEDALANARQEYNTTENVERKQWLEELFPELKESEDERIRKEIIEYLKDEMDAFPRERDDYQRWLTWIEKQGEQKPKWTEEDDANVLCCIAKAEKDISNGYVGRNKELIDWLKSLKQRMEGK